MCMCILSLCLCVNSVSNAYLYMSMCVLTQCNVCGCLSLCIFFCVSCICVFSCPCVCVCVSLCVCVCVISVCVVSWRGSRKGQSGTRGQLAAEEEDSSLYRLTGQQTAIAAPVSQTLDSYLKYAGRPHEICVNGAFTLLCFMY